LKSLPVKFGEVLWK